jgi:hypothetical protein
MSNVVLNISELLFETPDFWGDTTTLPVADVQLFQIMGTTPFFHRLFWVSKDFTHGGPFAYNRHFSWDHLLTTWCTHSIRKPLGS